MISLALSFALYAPAPVAVGSFQAADARQDERAAVAELSAMESQRLAFMVLEDRAAGATIVGHVAHPPFPMRPPPAPGQKPSVAFVQLFTEAAPTPEGICLRQTYGAEVRRNADGAGFEPAHSRARGHPEVRFDADCGAARGRRFAYLNGTPVGEAAALMQRLAAIQVAARRGRALGVDVECVSEIARDPCPRSDRRLVSSLPLDGAYHFQRSYDAFRRLELSMTETEPGNAYWKASFIEGGRRPVLRLTRQYPAPF